MKKAGIFIFSLFAFLFSNGQSVFNLFAGPQATTSKFLVGTEKQATEHMYGFHFGAAKKVAFDNLLFFYPSVSYSQKGYEVTLEKPSNPPGLDIVHDITTIHTVDVSPLFQFDFGKNPSHLFLRFGPTFDFAIIGKEELTYANGKTEKRDMTFSFNNYGRVGASLISQLGYEMERKFYISARYDHGVGSISNADGGPKINHRVLSLSLGVYFSKNKIVIDTRPI